MVMPAIVAVPQVAVMTHMTPMMVPAPMMAMPMPAIIDLLNRRIVRGDRRVHRGNDAGLRRRRARQGRGRQSQCSTEKDFETHPDLFLTCVTRSDA